MGAPSEPPEPSDSSDPSRPSDRAEPAERSVSSGSSDQYEGFAAAYAEYNENNAYNALYERPATLALLGDLRGKRVLDAGCGAGALSEAMLSRGAIVTCIDVSPRLVGIARARLGNRASVIVGDLTRPLPFGDSSFDFVAASLVMHYLERWEPTLREFGRILAPSGALVFSTHHPTMDWQFAGGNYFETRRISDVWKMKDGREVRVSFWRRPLTAMTSAIRSAGFLIEEIVEPMPLPECEHSFPRDFRKITTLPRFLFFRLIKPR